MWCTEKVLQVTPEELEEIYATYNTNAEKIAKDVEILKEWLKKQQHLPQELPFDDFLERFLTLDKFNIERTKKRIEMHFVWKHRNRNLYTFFRSIDYIPMKDSAAFCVALPKLGPLKERITIIGTKAAITEKYNFQLVLQLYVASLELRLRYERAVGVRLIVDGSFFNFEQIKKMDWTGLYKFIDLAQNAYGIQIIGIHVINTHPAVTILTNALKKILASKIGDKFKFYENLESLHQSIAPQYLPKEYGGTATSVAEMLELVNVAMEEHRDYFAQSVNYVIDENLKIGEIRNYDGLYGVDGTFKQINLD